MERAHFLFFVLCVSCRASGPDVSTSWHGVNVPRAASPSPEIVTANVVTLEYSDLVQGKDLTAEIERAFSYEGLGILAVLNVPSLGEKRAALLPLARSFAELPGDVKAKYEKPETVYSFGWSHGREKLQGKLDYAKGSFYANPQFDRPVDDDALIAAHSTFVHPNVWPEEGDFPALEPNFKALGSLVVEVGVLVAGQCDRWVGGRCPGYRRRKLEETIRTSKCCKGRLLHYFSKPAASELPVDLGGEREDKRAEGAVGEDDLFSDWCGWHNDHGSLTGLVPAMYLDARGREIPNPDPNAGLYIRSRSGELVRVHIPQGGLAFQIGETAQIHSGGLLQATPHAVRGADGFPGVTREAFAVFMEPNWDGDMDLPLGRTAQEALEVAAQVTSRLPPGVTPLASRWKEGISFGQFTDNTLGAFY